VGRNVFDGVGVIDAVVVAVGIGVIDGVTVGVLVEVGVFVLVGVHVAGKPRVAVPVGKGGLKGLIAIWGFTPTAKKAAIATTVRPRMTKVPI
jgi:hypothetical protein